MGLASAAEPKFTVDGFKSTYALLLGEPGKEDRIWAARVCARYCDGNHSGSVPVRMWLDSPSESELLEVNPIEESLLCAFRIGG